MLLDMLWWLMERSSPGAFARRLDREPLHAECDLDELDPAIRRRVGERDRVCRLRTHHRN